MNSDVPLDYALFQLSPRRTRCELFASVDGKTEKLASGFLKPFVTHLKVAEEQASRPVHLIKLEVGRRKNAAAWFNKGTVERFVRFVRTPEVLELVHTFYAEVSQLEGAREMYSQGAGGQFSGEIETKSVATADLTKKELLRAIDIRLIAAKQDLATACARAVAAGFNFESVSKLLLFADQFGAFRLSEACKKFLSLHQRRPDLISHQDSLPSLVSYPQWESCNDTSVHSFSISDMSIDEPETEQTGPARLTNCGDEHLSSLSIRQQQQQPVGEPAAATSEQSYHLEENREKEEDPAPTVASLAVPAQQAGGRSRRLSVQDRINLFESKQKEQSSASISSGSSGVTIARLAGARGEHHRNPSDVSSEKSVLRRWSGASDMSIELNSSSSNDRKESGSTAETPTSSANSQVQTGSRNVEIEGSGSTEASYYLLSSKSSLVATSSNFSSSLDQDRTFRRGETRTRDAVHRKGIALVSVEHPGLTMEKEKVDTWTHMSGSLDRLPKGGLVDKVVSQSRLNVFSKEPSASPTNSRSGFGDLENEQMESQLPSRTAPVLAVPAEPKDQASFMIQLKDQKEVDGIELKTQVTSVAEFGAFSNKKEDAGAKSKGASDSQNQFTASKSKMRDISAKDSSLHPQSHGRTFYDEQKEARLETLAAQVKLKKKLTEAHQSYASQGLRLPLKTSGTDQIKKFHGRRDELVPNAALFQSTEINTGIKAPLPLEESHTIMPNNDNHVLNDVLHMKADELEKLFAEHKLRVQGDQIDSTQRSKTLNELAAKSIQRPAQSPTKQMPEKSLLRQGSSNGVEFDSDMSLRMVDNFDFSDTKMQKIGNHTPLDDSRGKLYLIYMLKRDAKLREECGSNRAQKEAKMKAMHDSLELSEAKMKARFAEFSEGHIFARPRHPIEKMRTFNTRSTLKNKEQTSESLTGVGSDDEKEMSESSTGNQSKKLSNKTLPSSSTRASVSPTPKHSVKSGCSGYLRREAQTENPVAQSVPNFSDLKNEILKQSFVVSKDATQPKNLTRSKNFTEDAEIVKEDLSRLSNSVRKSLAIPGELKVLSSLNSVEILNKIQISRELKQHLKKGNGANHVSGAVMERLRTSITPEELQHSEKSEEIVNQQEHSPDMVNEEGELEKAYAEVNNLVMDLPIDSDGKLRQIHESGEPESENDYVMGPQSHQDDSTNIFSKFNSARNTRDSPEESSGSWNLQGHHSLVYTREALDIDASVDSPTVSPASWNSHPLNQMMDSEASRMRKKCGSAQIPAIAASSSHQSRRDVTKGFKRLLKFGRKNRGPEYLVNDWVSASTASEGDDDLEDGRDLVRRNLDDFSKSRMCYSINAYDGFNDGGAFPEQGALYRSSRECPISYIYYFFTGASLLARASPLMLGIPNKRLSAKRHRSCDVIASCIASLYTAS